MLDEGLGGSKDHAEAAKWFEKASVGGDLDASLRFASMRQTGLGVSQDIDIARQLLRQILISPLNDVNARTIKTLARQQLSNLPVKADNIVNFVGGPATAAPSASAWTNGVLKESSVKRQINHSTVQPKHSGREGGCLKCERGLIQAYLQRYFCVRLAVLPTSPRT
jgi:TPR repeat protein